MSRCEDFPCCGHEMGCCPDFCPETGRQLNMKCVCSAPVPLGGSSLCEGCLRGDPEEWGYDEWNYPPLEDEEY